MSLDDMRAGVTEGRVARADRDHHRRRRHRRRRHRQPWPHLRRPARPRSAAAAPAAAPTSAASRPRRRADPAAPHRPGDPGHRAMWPGRRRTPSATAPRPGAVNLLAPCSSCGVTDELREKLGVAYSPGAVGDLVARSSRTMAIVFVQAETPPESLPAFFESVRHDRRRPA